MPSTRERRDLRKPADVEDDPVARRLLSQLTRAGAISPRSADPRIKDVVSDLIVQALLSQGPSNIAQISRWIAEAKGKCARETVRKRLPALCALGVVSREDSGKVRVSASFATNWARYLLGPTAPGREGR